MGGWVGAVGCVGAGGLGFPPSLQKQTPARRAKIEVKERKITQNKTTEQNEIGELNQKSNKTQSKRHARTPKERVVWVHGDGEWRNLFVCLFY
jgi:arginine/lysine/ornithine decarboxylase